MTTANAVTLPRQENPAPPRFQVRASMLAGLRWTVGLGALVFVVGLFVAPERVWGGFLMGFFFLTALALAGPVFMAFLNLAGARWSVALAAIPQAMAAALPAAGLLGLVLIFGTHSLYEWSHGAVVDHDPLLQHKAVWLNTTGFSLRLILMFLVWIVFARRLSALARQEDTQDLGPAGAGLDPGLMAARRLKTSALFVAVLAVTWSIASFDWLMSLEPHWFSTIFALEQLGSLASVGVAAAVLLALAAERQGALAGVLRAEHLHDLGKLLFALTLFWAYCWYCQYMLIWYTNIPEETVHYVVRKQGPWWLLVQATLVLKWGVPFVALLARRTCRSRKVLGQVAGVVLVGNALDLYVQVGPALMGSAPVLGLWELGPLVGALALFFLVTLTALARRPMVPSGHPYLEQSLTYHTP